MNAWVASGGRSSAMARPDLPRSPHGSLILFRPTSSIDLIAQKAARGPKTSRTPIILLSARAGGEGQVEGMRPGANSYLMKSFSARQLLARVKARLKMFRHRPEFSRGAVIQTLI